MIHKADEIAQLRAQLTKSREIHGRKSSRALHKQSVSAREEGRAESSDKEFLENVKAHPDYLKKVKGLGL